MISLIILGGVSLDYADLHDLTARAEEGRKGTTESDIMHRKESIIALYYTDIFMQNIIAR